MKYLILAGVVMAASFGAQAGDIEAGKAKTATCAACHGPDGKTPIQDTYPKLAGQNAGYLEAAITAYKKGTRKGGTATLMTGMVAKLSKKDIANIAAYYSSLPAGDALPEPASEASLPE